VCQTHAALMAAGKAASASTPHRRRRHPVLPADGLGGRLPVLFAQA
jgi:hypothetical protein